MNWFDSAAALDAAVAQAERARPNACARVALALPLRANLSVLENVALAPLYRSGMGSRAHAHAQQQARQVLAAFDASAWLQLRDCDLLPAQRFVALLARALLLGREQVLIERPAAMLYDCPYPNFLHALAERAPWLGIWQVYDYAWNQPLYPHQGPRPAQP